MLFGLSFRWVSRPPISASPMNINVASVLVSEEQEKLRIRYEHVCLRVGTVKIQDPLFFCDIALDRLERVVAANLVTLHEAKSRVDNLPLLDGRCAAQAL